MAKNTVTNAKKAARKFLSAVVDGVKAKGGKLKGEAAVANPSEKVVPKKTTDTPAVAALPKKKGKKKGKKTAEPSGPVTDSRTVRGAELTTAAREGADGVKRTRASWNGYSLCSLLKWVGFHGGDIDNARALVAGLGLSEETSASTISCQFYSGAQLALGKKGKPTHSGQPADLTTADAKIVKKLAGM